MAWNRGGPFHFRAMHISGQTRKNMKKKCLRKQDIDFDCMHVHFHRYNTKYYMLILYTILYHIIQYDFLLPACIPTKLQAYIDNHKYVRLQLPRTFSYIYVYTCTCLLNIYVYVCIYTCTHTHTCSDLSYRIVMWNASGVQKCSIESWSGRKKNWDWELTLPCRVPNKRQINCRSNHRHSQKIGTTVLSCAIQNRGFHQRQIAKMTTWRFLGWVSYHHEIDTSMSGPIDITGSWWVSLLVPVSSVPPARNRNQKTSGTSFTSGEMFHTHAPQQRGFFGRCKNG